MYPKGILAPHREGNAFIAGGYAACPALAGDLDLWVWVDERKESLSHAREQILLWLEAELWPYEAQGGLQQVTNDQNPNYPVQSMKVALVRSPYWSHPVQIIVTTADPNALLETFDISTHQIAIVFGNVIKGSGWTPITETPRILRMTPTTPERLERIAARYGHSLTPQGVR
jgi:hypothetical protein